MSLGNPDRPVYLYTMHVLMSHVSMEKPGSDGPPNRTALEAAQTLVMLGAVPDSGASLPPGLAEATGQLLAAAGLMSPHTLAALRLRERNIPGTWEWLGHRKAFC